MYAYEANISHPILRKALTTNSTV